MTNFLRVGDRFLDRYTVSSVLGTGGMSRVYAAVQDGLERKVAIKLLAPQGGDKLSSSEFDNIEARFEREAQLISKFRSPHTVIMYDYGRDGDFLYMILEHVDGQNLHELVKSSGAVDYDRVVRIVRQALASLAEAHSIGILHRDIKPQNIMVFEHLGDPDNAKVLDFGIAKAIGESGRDKKQLTAERTIVGTPSYMSPEQILGNALHPSSDIYSLGLVAYELLFGIVAVDADSAVSTMARHLQPTPIEFPEDHGLPAELYEILRKMVAKDPDERFQSAMDVLQALAAWDGGDSGVTIPRLTTPHSGQLSPPTLDGPPQTTSSGATAAQQNASQRPLIVSTAVLTVTIVICTAIIVALAWMMLKQESVEEQPVAAAAMAPAPAPPVVEPEPVEPPVATPPADVGPPEAAQPTQPEVDEQQEAQSPPRGRRKKPKRAARVKAAPSDVESDAPKPTKPEGDSAAIAAAQASAGDEPEPDQPPAAKPEVDDAPAPNAAAVSAATSTAAPTEPQPQPAEPKPAAVETVTAPASPTAAQDPTRSAKTAPANATESDEDEDAKKKKKKRKKKKKVIPRSF